MKKEDIKAADSADEKKAGAKVTAEATPQAQIDAANGANEQKRKANESKLIADKAAAEKRVAELEAANAANEKKNELLAAQAVEDAAEIEALRKQNAAFAANEKAMSAAAEAKPAPAAALGENFEHNGVEYAFKVPRFAVLNPNGATQNYSATNCPDKVKVYLIENNYKGIIAPVS